MGTARAGFAALPLLLLAPFAQAGLEHKTSEASLSARYFAWDETVYGASGWQFVTPLTLTSSYGLDGVAIDVGLMGAYIRSHNTTPGASGSYDGPTDTNLSFAVTWVDLGSWQPFVSADLNLPTGEETLRGTEKRALMDPDLVWQIRFGEGFNANLSAGVSAPLTERLTGTIAAGYNERLAFVPDGDTGAEYDPGGQASLLLGLQYMDDALLASLTGRYLMEERADRNNAAWFDPGDNFELAGELSWTFTDTDMLGVNVIYSQSERNAYFGLPEKANGNGAVVTGKISVSRNFGDLTAELNAGGLLRTENDYDAASDFFIPQRTKWDIGAATSGRIGEAFSWSAGVNWGRMEDGDTPFLTPGQSYDTWTGALTGAYAF